MINRINEKKIINVNAIKDPDTGKIIVQKPFPPTTCLAIEGGGSRCLAYAGAYRVAYETGQMDEVIHVSGSSGGSICALAIALGYDPDEVDEALLELKMERFLEDSQSALSASTMLAKAKTLLSVLMSENYSLSSGNEFLEWMRAKVEKKMGNKHATFEDLAKKIAAQGSRRNKYLYITGTNISLVPLPECKIFSHETSPKMELALAPFISSCLPGAFPPVKYDGHLWFDGGIMNNLPTKLFDDRRFLPPGYDFNNKGLNPCVLAWKVDTKDEISQVLYGIIKKIDLSSASEVVIALHNGLTQNSNIDEIREGRLALALSDNNIGVLEFALEIRRKKDLIFNSIKETREFYENYYDAVYEAIGYENTLAWLDSLSLEEIIFVKSIYARMPDKTKTLDDYLVFIREYLHYRMELIENPECRFDLPIPDFHVNIPPAFGKNPWSIKIESGMKEKLKLINMQMKSIKQKMNCMGVEFKDFPVIAKTAILHHKAYFPHIQALTGYFEAQKILCEEKANFQVKLGIFANKISCSIENRKPYNLFRQTLKPLLASDSISEDLKIVLPELPVFKFRTGGCESGMIYSFDLRMESDRNLYIIASLMYLFHIKSNEKNISLFVNLFRDFLPKTNFPRNYKELGAIFHMQGIELLVTAYRMEVLLHYFEKKAHPKREPALTIDEIFGVDKLYKSQDKYKYEDKYKYSRNGEGEIVMPLEHVVHTGFLFKDYNNEEDLSSDEEDCVNGYKPSWFNNSC